MSYHEGSNWQARKEDNKEPFYKNEERTKTSLVSLEELPAGSLFYYNNTLCLKTEYKSVGGAIEAFIVGSGEMFWGPTKDAQSQRKLMVSPVSQSPSIPQPGFIEMLRAANPYQYSNDEKYNHYYGWNECVDKAAELLKGKGEERRLQRQEDNNEHLDKCLKMLKYLYMNEYCGEHGEEVRQLIMPRPQPKTSFEALDDNK